MSRPRVRIQSSAKAGEIVEIRTLIDHPMESGIRTGGAPVPRNILGTFTATMNGAPLFQAEFGNGSSANPYFVFFAKVDKTSEFGFVWTHENGESFRASATVKVG